MAALNSIGSQPLTHQTSYCDSLSGFANNGAFYYRIGSVDKVGNERLPGQSAWSVNIPVFFSPRIAPKSSQIVVCSLSGAIGTQSDALTTTWDFLNNITISGFEIEIDGPNGKVTKIITDPATVSFDCPLDGGDGLYEIRLLALYPNLQNTIYSNTIKVRKKTTLPFVEGLNAIQDTGPTGNIILSWSAPDPAEEIVEFQVFTWTESEQQPEEPIRTLPVDSLRWIQTFQDDGLSAYECNFYQVRKKDCFGLVSEDTTIVSQYSNRPPQFDAEKTESNANNITVYWDRPSPRFGENAAFETLITVYQDSITPQPFDSVVVFNATQYLLLNLQPMHNYIFRIRETILGNVGQSCSNSFIGGFSQPLTVPLDNLPPPVTFETQALPVHPDSTTGTAFILWQRPNIPSSESFLIKWHSKSNTDSLVVFDTDTAQIRGLDLSQEFGFSVHSIDSLNQRSRMSETDMVNFKPRWVFTPSIQALTPKCFKEKVIVSWDWVDEAFLPLDNTLGADSVIVEISIDSSFVFKKSTVVLDTRKSHTFERAADFPFANNQNTKLYARIRAKDRFGHFSPWSTEYLEFDSPFGEFDEISPQIVNTTIDSVKAPTFGVPGEVDIYLSWEDAGDNCSGTWFYEISRNDSIVARDTSRVPVHFYVDRNLKVDTNLLSFSWQVHAVDSVGNRQELAGPSSLPVILFPPDSMGCVNDSLFCWQPNDQNSPDLPLTYFVEGARFESLFGNALTNITAGSLSGACYDFSAPWEGIYWRVKARAGEVESAWSQTFFCELNPEPAVTSITNGYSVPKEYFLAQNYPNPFNPTTIIEFNVAESGLGNSRVLIDVFNLTGQRIRSLVDEEKQPGEHRVVWDGHDEFGNLVSSGVYFYRMQVNDFKAMHKMIFLR